MRFSINKILANVPVLVCREQDAAEEGEKVDNIGELHNVSVLMLNPTNRQPRVKGVVYAYSLLPVANDVIMEKALLQKMVGVNSTSDHSIYGFEVPCKVNDVKEALTSFFSRGSGLLDPSISNRINKVGNHGLNNFLNFLNSKGTDIEQVLKSKTDKISAMLFSSFTDEDDE